MRLRVVFIIFLILNPFNHTGYAQESEFPYLYYYSNILNAFVIERADGTDSRMLIEYRPHSASIIGSSGVVAYVWFPDSKWMITVEDLTYAGGKGPDGIGVFSIDGDVRRELTVCRYSEVCTNWLPSRVLPHLSDGTETSVLQAPTFILPHDNNVTGVAWSPDGTMLASYDGAVHIWDITDSPPQLLTTLEAPRICSDWPLPCFLTWSPDSRRVATQNHSQIWEVSSGELIDEPEGRFVNWSADGSYISSDLIEVVSPNTEFVARVQQHGLVEVADSDSGEQLIALQLEDGHAITSLEWMPDSSELVINNDLGGIIFWNIVTTQVRTLEKMDEIYTVSLDVSSDSRLVAGGGPFDPIYVWLTESGELLTIYNWYAMAVAFNPAVAS